MGAPLLEFLPQAGEEVEEALAWYAERSLTAAHHFMEELEGALERIREAPGRWREAPYGTRRHGLHRFPYNVVYRCQEGVVTVIAVAHDRRRPGYWRERARDTDP